MKHAPTKLFRIIDNPIGAERHGRFALLDPTDTIVRVHDSTRFLADLAFDTFMADEVRHDENLLRAETCL